VVISDQSIKRPTLVVVLMCALLALGIFSYRRLSIELYPNIEVPVVFVETRYPGASPETVEREVSKRIEEQINSIAGVKHIVSYSREGVSLVMAEFRLEEKLNDAAQEVRVKVSGVGAQFPEGVEEPVILKHDMAALPVVSLALTSDTLDARGLTALAEKKIKRGLETIAGVGKVNIVGGSKREIGVVVDPARLEALGLGIDEVIGGLRAENIDMPLGRLTHKGSEYALRIAGKPDDAGRIGGLIIAQREGRPIRLSEVAQVIDGVEEPRTLGLVNGRPAVVLDIIRQTGANEVALVEDVKKAVEKLKPVLPPGVVLSMVRDGSVETRASVEDVRTSLILGALLTIAIVFCFINSWRSTVITGLALPISVISSFIAMYFLGMTLNMLTLMALSLSIGFLIDDAIVVRENIVRHMEMGMGHFEAARRGTNEIGPAVLATTLSIIAVFIPVAFMKGIIGRFFFHFGLTVAFAVLVSLFVSFSLDPMLSSRWPDPAIGRRGNRRGAARILERFNLWFERVADNYQNLIGWALDHRKTVAAITLAAFVAGVDVLAILEASFMPVYDKGEFQIAFKTAPDAALAESSGRLEAMLASIRDIPEIERTYSSIGAGAMGMVQNGPVYVKLKDRSLRSRQQDEIQQDIRARLQQIPGISFSLEDVAGTNEGGKTLQVNIRGSDIDLLKQYSARLRDAVALIPGIVDIEGAMDRDTPEYRLQVDRERALAAGITSSAIAGVLNPLVGGQAVTPFEDEDGAAVDVRVRLPEALRAQVGQVENLNIPIARGEAQAALIPLADLVSHEIRTMPSEINREDLSRQATIGANLEGLALSTAVEKVSEAAQKIGMAPGYSVVFTGETEFMEETFGYMIESLILAVLFVYLILAAQFESFIDPLSIMFSLPLAIVGMAGMLAITGDTINIMSLIGLILLMGLVTKNAILLIDCAKNLRAQGMDRREALITAGRTRFRPIMMTTSAMIAGMLPLAFAVGAGAGMRAPMARAVIGGLLTSTALTLVVVPVMYTLLDDLKRKGAVTARPIKGV